MLFGMFLGTLLSGAATLALTRVLAFAAVIASLASALAFTGILALAGVLALLVVGKRADRGSSLALDAGCVRLHCKRPAQQTGNSGAGDHRF
jgi:hypothetical protein